jgi:diguanylate cyclase (GGDEF)-like protein
LDIDFFKKINDTYGHGAGDEVLQKLVKILSENVRNNDYVIRWGGEEFIILLPECNIYESYEVAERIRRSVENYEDACCKFTISVGLTRYDGNDYNNSIKNADKALYYSKEHGRNKVSVYERLRA